MSLQRKQHYQDNIEAISLQHKQHYEDNRAKLLEKMKEYRKENEYKIKEKKNETCVCDCGITVKLGSMCMHIKTKKHLNFLKSTQDEYEFYFKQWIQFYTDNESIEKQMKNQEYIDRFDECWKLNW